MTRWKITIEYHGGRFSGWQRQASGETVQQHIEEAIEKLCGHPVRITGAGRTDAGVHALGQVAHFDLERPTPDWVMQDALNAHLREVPISIIKAETVPGGFDARLKAIRRHYLYKILNRRPPAAVEEGFVWHVSKPLDEAAMHEAAQLLVGQHDFTSFRASECQARSPVKTISRIDVIRDGDHVAVAVTAPSFLHHQVRNMVGTLKLVGEGAWDADRVTMALEARQRSSGGPTAPACGLYFVGVEY